MCFFLLYIYIRYLELTNYYYNNYYLNCKAMKGNNLRYIFIFGIFSLIITCNVFSQEDLNFDLPDASVFDTPATVTSDTVVAPSTTVNPSVQPAVEAVTPSQEVPVQEFELPSAETITTEPASPVQTETPVQEVTSPQPTVAPVQQVAQSTTTYPTVSSKPWISRGWRVNGSFGSNLFYGDLRIYSLWPAKQYNNERKWAGSLMLEKELVPYLDLRGQVVYGNLSGTKREYSSGTPANMYFDATMLETSTNFKFNLTNAILGREAAVSLYGYAGIGLVTFRSSRKDLRNDKILQSFGYDGTKKITPTIETMVPMGLGIEFKATDNLFIDLDLSMRVVNTDKLDAFVSPDNAFFQDMYGYTSIGVAYKFGDRTPFVPPVPVVETVTEVTPPPVVDSVVAVVDTVPAIDSTIVESIPQIEEVVVVAEEPIQPIVEQPSPIVEKFVAPAPTTVDGVMYQNVDVEKGLVYRIQIIAVQTQKDSKVGQLKRLYNLNEIIYEEKIEGWYKYTVGSFPTVQGALNYRQVLIQKGVKDAFIVPYYQGKRITNQQARDLQSK